MLTQQIKTLVAWWLSRSRRFLFQHF